MSELCGDVTRAVVLWDLGCSHASHAWGGGAPWGAGTLAVGPPVTAVHLRGQGTCESMCRA